MRSVLIKKSGEHLLVTAKKEQLVAVVVLRQGELSLRVELKGERSEVLILGVVMFTKRSKVKLRTETVHERAGTRAETVIHGVGRDRATAEIEGMIRIKPGAKEVNDFLTERVLLFEEARAMVEPALEIKANEVRASHAATVSQVGEEQLFYLMSRGLKEEEAKKEIEKGFLEAILERIRDVKIREQARRKIFAKEKLC